MSERQRRFVVALLGAGAVSGLLAAPLLAGASPKVVGNPTAGKAVFLANCAVCHTLKAAGAQGQIGPNLDRLSLAEATIVKQVMNGGPALMGKAAAKYTTTMVGYKNVLSPTQIQNVAAFVYTAQRADHRA